MGQELLAVGLQDARLVSGGCGRHHPTHPCAWWRFQLVLGRDTSRGCFCCIHPGTSSAAAYTSVSTWETAVQMCWGCLKLGVDLEKTTQLWSCSLVSCCVPATGAVSGGASVQRFVEGFSCLAWGLGDGPAMW